MTTLTQAPSPVRGLIGVIHLLPMPGDPASLSGGFDAVEAHAMRDAHALAGGGVNGIIIENFGSSPFRKGTKGARVPAHQVALMAILARRCAQEFPHLAIGVNCLRNDALSALGVAAASGARFVRVNVHSGAYVTDQGLIEGEAEASLRYRASLRSEVAIFADVLVKHASPLAPLTATDAVHDVLLRGRAAGVIVTGRATGAPVDADLLAEVRAAAIDAPVWIGSGLTPDSAPRLAPFADAAIVGTWLKEGGVLSAPVDLARVRDLAAALSTSLRKPLKTDKDQDAP